MNNQLHSNKKLATTIVCKRLQAHFRWTVHNGCHVSTSCAIATKFQLAAEGLQLDFISRQLIEVDFASQFPVELALLVSNESLVVFRAPAIFAAASSFVSGQ